MKRYEVRLSSDAEVDLLEIRDYIAENDSPKNADYVLARVLEVVDSLEALPQRGSHPRELLAMGHGEYRQVFFKPYRIVYFVEETTVQILLVADGRRDLRTLLEQRLLGA